MNIIIMRCVNFFVDELLWMMTWGWYQITFGLVLSWFIFMLMGRMRFLPALFLTIGSYLFAVTVYFAFVSCILINFFQWKFIAGGRPNVYSAIDASLLLAGILSVMQFIFYCMVNYWRPLFVSHFFILSLVSNLIAAFCASFFIKLVL